MMGIHVDTSGFTSWLRKASEGVNLGAQQALNESVTLALKYAQSTALFRDRTGELRKSITRGTSSTWTHFITATAKHALFVEEDTKAHEIRARNVNALRFVQAGQIRFAKRVWHPGTVGTHFMRKAGDEGGRALVELLERMANRVFQ
jgi:hypothetical protein